MELLMGYAVPNLKRLHQYGCHGYCDCTIPPWRAWPDVYIKVSEAADIHIILATGFYREMELGTYWVKTEADAIWPWVREATVEELAEMCIREFEDGIHGTDVRPGCLKLGTSSKEITPTELKTFRAVAMAQKETGMFARLTNARSGLMVHHYTLHSSGSPLSATRSFGGGGSRCEPSSDRTYSVAHRQ